MDKEFQETNSSQLVYSIKKTIAILIVAIVIAIAVTTVLAVWFDIFLPLYISFAFSAYLIYIIIGIVCEIKLPNALALRCNPYKYYRYLKIVRNCLIITMNKLYDKINLKINLAVGLRLQGKFNKAKKMILSIDINKFTSFEQLPLYYNNLCDLLILLSEYDLAQNALDIGFCALDNVTDEKENKRLFNYLKLNQAHLKMVVSGITDDYEVFLLASLSEADEEHNRVGEHYSLGEYYQITKQYDKALSHLEYVVQRGNKLFNVKQAKELIKKIKMDTGIAV